MAGAVHRVLERVARRARDERHEEARVVARLGKPRRGLEDEVRVHLDLRQPAARQQREHGRRRRVSFRRSRVSRRVVCVAASCAIGWPTYVTGMPASSYSGGSNGNSASMRSTLRPIVVSRSRRHAHTDGLTK